MSECPTELHGASGFDSRREPNAHKPTARRGFVNHSSLARGVTDTTHTTANAGRTTRSRVRLPPGPLPNHGPVAQVAEQVLSTFRRRSRGPVQRHRGRFANAELDYIHLHALPGPARRPSLGSEASEVRILPRCRAHLSSRSTALHAVSFFQLRAFLNHFPSCFLVTHPSTLTSHPFPPRPTGVITATLFGRGTSLRKRASLLNGGSSLRLLCVLGASAELPRFALRCPICEPQP